MLGRIRSEVIIAGAEDCANPDFDRRFATTIPLPAIAEPSRKWRRLSWSGFLRFMATLIFKNTETVLGLICDVRNNQQIHRCS
jgi:hypothetical protein